MKSIHQALVALMLASLSWSSTALAKDPIKWTLTLGDPLRDSNGASQARRVKLSEEARDRLEMRLRAAQADDAVVKSLPSGDVSVEFRAKQELAWYKALLLSPGHVEFRPIYTYGFNWMSVANELPASVELRGENPQPDYIWSSERTALESALRRITSSNFGFAVGPATKGWRSYTMGKSIGSSDEVRHVKVRKSSGGMAYVTFSVTSTLVDRLAASELSEVKEWAILLDGEVIDVVSRQTLATGKLELTAPRRLMTREDSGTWACQVAGRMAAPMPIPIAVFQE